MAVKEKIMFLIHGFSCSEYRLNHEIIPREWLIKSKEGNYYIGMKMGSIPGSMALDTAKIHYDTTAEPFLRWLNEMKSELSKKFKIDTKNQELTPLMKILNFEKAKTYIIFD